VIEPRGTRNVAHDIVVRPLSRATGRPCARPGCPVPASATLVFQYGARDARLRALTEEPTPATYDLCPSHADRTTPPNGWTFVDERPREDTDGPDDPQLGGDATIAVLTAALSGGDEGASPALDTSEDTLDPLRAALEELQAVAAGGDEPEEQGGHAIEFRAVRVRAEPAEAAPRSRGSRPAAQLTLDGDEVVLPVDQPGAPATRW
jgi:hypothetical protein